MIKLTKRMQAVADAAADDGPHGCICEIGCDHGKILGYLLQSGAAKRGIFADISAQCLNKAQELAEHRKLKNCRFIISDGFKKFDPRLKIDSLIIAGMGGKNMAGILQHQKAGGIRQLTLQPNRDVVYLRQEVVDRGYEVVQDFAVEDGGKIYAILKAIKK